ERFRSKHVGVRLAHDLIAQVAAALAADLVVFTNTGDGWNVLAYAGEAPTTDSAELAAVLNQLPASTLTTRQFGGATWTLVQATQRNVRAALAVMGNWTFSSAPLSNLADAVCLNLTRRHLRPTLESAARIDQLLYRMTRQVARAQTAESVADAVLRHAATAVHARMGALAVKTPGGDDTSIVATFGYSRKLVEHVRIEPGVGAIGSVMRTRRPLKVDRCDRQENRRLRYRTNSFVVVPILSGTEAVGAVCVTDHV